MLSLIVFILVYDPQEAVARAVAAATKENLTQNRRSRAESPAPRRRDDAGELAHACSVTNVATAVATMFLFLLVLSADELACN